LNTAHTITLYQPTLHAIAMQILKCKADAEDVVQETFIKWLNTEQEKIQNTKAYLIAAVKNNCLSHLQAIKNKKVEYIDSISIKDFVDKLKDSEFPSVDIDGRLAKAMHIISEKLEPLERAVYLLKEVFDFDYKALQELLDKKQDHCRQLLCRARKKLNDEKELLNALIQPKKTALFESFRNACHFDNAGELVEQLRNDIGKALSKNS
jgi:RNA polymerase sigma factor (sigma-70 family)